MNARERAFVLAYIGPANGNGTHAAILAGYGKRGAHVQASRMLRKAKVAAAIKKLQTKREEKAEAKTIAAADERDVLLSDIARDPTVDVHARVGAIRELNKCSGRHSMTHLLKGRLTLEQALAESRASE